MAIVINELSGAEIREFLFDEIAKRSGIKDEYSVLTQSKYWADFCDYFRYVYYLPDWELQRIRRHTFHLTSDIYQRYYFADAAFRTLIIKGYEFFTGQLGGFELDENGKGIGIESDGRILSHDLLRYLGVLVDLVQSGAIDRMGQCSQMQSIMEIGGGYGGLARCIQKYKPGIAYVIVDLEETCFFSMCYLKEQLPETQLFFVNDSAKLYLEPNSIYFVPQHRLEVLEGLHFDLAISQQSLQEMTQGQVSRYLDFIKDNCSQLYSCNITDHGQLANDKKLIMALDGFLADELGEANWIGTHPQSGNFYGDNHLNRQLFKLKKPVCSDEAV